jgi:NADPH:quinone reductase-like Zn-dependent oxidoreductase
MLTLAGTGYLGYDAAGVADEVGEGATGVSVGDDVFGRGQNTQAESGVLGAWAAKPPSIDWAVAAAAGVAGETSERGLRLLGIKAGDTILGPLRAVAPDPPFSAAAALCDQH